MDVVNEAACRHEILAEFELYLVSITTAR